MRAGYCDTVIDCNDGDTCKIKTAEKQIKKIRIWGIDAPENGQENAEKSIDYLNKLLADKELKLECIGKSYNRDVCKILVSGEDVGGKMVSAGWAWNYQQYSKGKYQQNELLARKAHIGLWSGKKILSPYCYRYTGTKRCQFEKHQYQP